MKAEETRKLVRDGYAKIAKQHGSCCSSTESCCQGTLSAKDISKEIGYTEEELKTAPEGANLGLGCGNPVALASLREGETVLDLGAGAGFDCFLAANEVGPSGRVIGVDMTPEMVEKARENAERNNYQNVEFRLAEIEHLPVADDSVDVIISNCVINLSPDKGTVFREAFRVLKPGGKLMISDLVLLKELPNFLKNSARGYVGCISGAMLKEKYIETITAAGFQKTRIVDETLFPVEYIVNDLASELNINGPEIPSGKMNDLSNSIASLKIEAMKPDRMS